MNLYGFAGGNPVNESDPDGLNPGLFSGVGESFGTGWAGWSTAVWAAPGLKQLNKKFSIYSPGNYANQPGFKASLAFGTLGRDALIAAATQKAGGTLATRVPGGSSLMTWWNLGIGNKVPMRDWFAYEVGQKTLNPANYAKYKQISDAATRGRTIISEQGLWRAIRAESSGFLKLKGKGATLGTGPTPGARAGIRGLGLAGLAFGEYYSNKSIYDRGWAEITK